MTTLAYRPSPTKSPTLDDLPGSPLTRHAASDPASSATSRWTLTTGPLRRVSWLAVLAVLAGEVLVVVDVRVPVLRAAIGLAVVVGVPALVLGRRLVTTMEPLVAFLYGAGAAVLGVIVVALALNTVLPWAGVTHPLGAPALVVTSTVIDLTLVARRPDRPLVPWSDLVAAAWRARSARLDPAVTCAVLAVLLAVAGAIRLNNGQGGAVAVTGHALAMAALGFALLDRHRRRPHDTVVVFLVAVALLLGTSLRGWFVTGHDIQQEYLSYLFTHAAEHWQMSAYPSPYNACLSVNILPTVLSAFSGVSGAYVFKALLQIVFALVPLCVYVSARRLASPRMALLSAALFMIFPTFFTDMPYLVRQEVAYLFVALALLAATQNSWSPRVRRAAAFAFGVGVVLSHYSTTYVLIITLVLAMLGMGAGTFVRNRRERDTRLALLTWRSGRGRRPRTKLILISPLMVLALAGVAWAWTSPATHTGGHLVDTVGQLSQSILHGRNATSSSDLKNSPFGGGGPTPEQRLTSYARASARAQELGDPDSYVFPHATGSIANPPLAKQDYVPLTGVGRFLAGLGIDVRSGNALVRLATAGLFELFLVIGALALVLQTRRTRQVGRERFWLAWGSLGALGAVVLVPGLSADYGVLRAFQQTLLFASPFVAVGIVTALSRLGRAAFPVTTGIALAMGLVLTGAQPALVGGYPALLSQSNAGQYYDLLYVSAPEMSAAKWLGDTTRGSALQYVSASDIVSITRLQSFVGRNVVVTGQFFPTQLQRSTFVFLEPQTVDRGQATIFYTGDLLTYRYPVSGLNQRLDVVYSTDGTRIYR